MKLDADLGVAHSYLSFFFFHLLSMLWRRVTSIVLLFKIFTARIPK